MSSASFWLVLIETSGNQRHIFETNKLAENVGASEQLYRLGTTHVLEAIRGVFPDSMSGLLTADDVHDPGINCRIEDAETQVEVWYLSSGKALLFVRDRDNGRKIVQHVTRTAAVSYPGVVVRGAIQEICNFTHNDLSADVKAIHENIERKRTTLPPEDRRFQRLPVVAECRNSGLPAAGMMSEGQQLIDVSAVCAAKRGGLDRERRVKWIASIRERMSEVIPGELLGAYTLDHLESWLNEMRYVAVVHADGNGVGKIFRDFSSLAGCAAAREYIDSLRAFSRGIDECTKAAFHDAVDLVCRSGPQFTTIDHGKRELKVPLLPLIAGGDDVTLLTTAEFAMAFVPEFLRRLEQNIDQHIAVAPIAKRASGVRRLGMTVGIAIVKPHYPFFAAYSIAEGLLSDAKREVKRRVTTRLEGEGSDVTLPVTAFDFHIHHSSGGNDIGEIRSEMKFKDVNGQHCRLWGGPYLVTNDYSAMPEAGQKWAEEHDVERLDDWVTALRKMSRDDSGRRELPNSQMHSLRSALFDGPLAIDAFLQQSDHRYPSLGRVLAKAGGVFREEQDKSEVTQVTSLLDAMALAHLNVRLRIEDRDSNDSPEIADPIMQQAGEIQ